MRIEVIYGTTLLAISAMLGKYATSGGNWHILWWPALAFAFVSIAYFTRSPIVFGKRSSGTRHWLSTILLAPYLIFVQGVWMLHLFISRESAFHIVDDCLIVSRRLRSNECPQNVSIYCDLTTELCDPVAIRNMAAYRCFPILDGSAPSPNELVEIIQQLRNAGDECLLIHCAQGYGRTGLVAAAWLIAKGMADTVDGAISILRKARPGIRLSGSQRVTLERAITGLRNANCGATSHP